MKPLSPDILVVEDERGMRITLADSLEDQGYRVIACADGKEALRCIQETPPTLVIADLMLPDVGGLEILEDLKKCSPDSVFILITGHASLETAVEALNQGAFAYITKPFNLDEVHSSVRNALEQRRLQLENRRLLEDLQRTIEELRQRTTDLETANRELELFSYSVSHELNNPLATVITFARLLLMQELPSPVAQDVGKVLAEAQRAAGVVQSLLALARRRRTQRRYVNVVETLTGVLALKASDLQENHIELRPMFDLDLPRTLVDEAQLVQVFLNIVTNAQEAMGKAGGVLSVAATRVGGRVRLSFTDTGPGIRAEDLHRVFDPFYTTKEGEQGTGLGLSMCYRVVQAHSGKIWVESQGGQGATFHVELPILGPEVAAGPRVDTGVVPWP